MTIGHARQISNGVANVFEAAGSGDLAGLGERHEGMITAEDAAAQRNSTLRVLRGAMKAISVALMRS
jgi:hypothetical protein